MSITQLLLASALTFSACAGQDEEYTPTSPRIIEVFACSDYCPGPEEKYMKKVYEGIEDEETCLKLGGTPYTYLGWGSYFVCIAE